MRKLLIFMFTLFAISLCYSQGGGGISINFSTEQAIGVDVFVYRGNNRFHLGYDHQFNGQKKEIIKNPKESYGLTEIEDGTYFWVIDLGYSRVIKNKITVHPELSIGGEKEFINFQDDRFVDDGYSLITNKKLAVGIGLNIGCLMRKGVEPFIGFHTLKKITFGIRFSQ